MVSVIIFKESRYPVNRGVIREAVEEILSEERVKGKIEVSVAIVGDRKMRDLKKQYLGENETTDVLSFSQQEGNDKFIPAPDGVLRLGDVIISYPEALKNAAEENLLLDEEIKILVRHGIKHLLGKHHEE